VFSFASHILNCSLVPIKTQLILNCCPCFIGVLVFIALWTLFTTLVALVAERPTAHTTLVTLMQPRVALFSKQHSINVSSVTPKKPMPSQSTLYDPAQKHCLQLSSATPSLFLSTLEALCAPQPRRPPCQPSWHSQTQRPSVRTR